jgi:hypothetical protein
MFNDRDLGILGAGALLAVLCLFLPLSFAGKVVIGFLVLIGFMALALLRLGPDRVPLEVWLTRRFRYSMQTRQYVNQQTATRKTESVQPSQKQKPERPVKERPTIEHSAPSFSAPSVVHSIDIAWNEVGVYPLLTILLGVVGVYFAVWLANGGAVELSFWFR